MTEGNELASSIEAQKVGGLATSFSNGPRHTSLPLVIDIVRLLATRERLEQAADLIIELLNNLDGDSDEEPSLASIGNTAECRSFDQRRWADGCRDDLEEDVDVL